MALSSVFCVGGPEHRPFRVCFVSHAWAHGGAQLSLIELIDALTARGVECRVVVPEGGETPSALEARGVPYLACQYRPWTWATALPIWDRVLLKPMVHVVRAVKLARLIRAWQCDVIVTNTITVCEGALAARLLRIPHITHAREFGDERHGLHFEWGPRLSVRVLSSLSACVVFNSKALAAHYSGQVPAERSRVIYNAVSVPSGASKAVALESSGRESARFRCVLVGWLSRGKGHDDAIRAIGELGRRGIPVELKIVGGGGSAAYIVWLRQLIEELGVAANVEMVGHASDASSFLCNADVALTCSRMEAFGRVTVEAMKLGTPVIGARSGGTPEIIRDGFNGLLYSPGDTKELADKIELLRRDARAAHEMSERARRFATEMFTIERHGQAFWSLLQDVARPSACRASDSQGKTVKGSGGGVRNRRPTWKQRLKRVASEVIATAARTGVLDRHIPYVMERVVPRLLYPGVLPAEPQPRGLRGLPVAILCNPHNPMHRVPYWFGVLFERPLDAFLRRVLRPGDNVIDAGANFGHITMLSAALVQPRGVVHAFEPHPLLARLLRDHAAGQPCATGVHVWQRALSDHSGVMTLRVNPDWLGASTLRPDPSRGSRTGTFAQEYVVEVVRADDLCLSLTPAGKVIVKIDVEGHEPAVIAGMSTLLSRVDAVVLEVTPSWIGGASGVARLLDDLMNLGFEAWEMDSVLEDRLRRSSVAALLGREQTNLLFARPSLVAAHFTPSGG